MGTPKMCTPRNLPALYNGHKGYEGPSSYICDMCLVCSWYIPPFMHRVRGFVTNCDGFLLFGGCSTCGPVGGP